MLSYMRVVFKLAVYFSLVNYLFNISDYRVG